ncbi:hypothetical protein Vretimale_1807 [Volvox reticuliferus]|uniref:Uncharacterized protein n=1 Tax=Volvox reticuliferus TaxID=1737510 RepID=A0A8J4FYN9_9CHLO|nr:hypothetical protein Vretifemale_17445 [Volvox reticuliferus]GIL95872.1 hypothetical protein Vretimale_1807 [Volvox reticuliferus]
MKNAHVSGHAPAFDLFPHPNHPYPRSCPGTFLRSELWMMVEAALAKTAVLAPPGTTTTTAQGLAMGLDSLSSVRPASTATSTPFACRLIQASVTQQAPGLNGLFRSISRECPATPRGMGPLPTQLTPSFTMASLTALPGGKFSRDGAASELPSLEPEWESFAEVPAVLEGTTGGAEGSEDEDLFRHHHQQKHDVAFAAGIAAATSTATAVSHAAASAMTELAGMLSQMSMSGSTMLKHLGANLLHVGGSLAVSQLQVRFPHTLCVEDHITGVHSYS